MKKEKARKKLEAAQAERRCVIVDTQELGRTWLLPLLVGEKLFLAANEDDFLLNGYTVMRLRDVARIRRFPSIYMEIQQDAGMLAHVAAPLGSVARWAEVFAALAQAGHYVSIDLEDDFVIGSIVAVYKKHVLVRHFDGDGIWEEEPREIPYACIQRPIFADRYTEGYARHLRRSAAAAPPAEMANVPCETEQGE